MPGLSRVGRASRPGPLVSIAERPHLLHVATSRAQDHLVVLLDPDAAKREPALAPLVELMV